MSTTDCLLSYNNQIIPIQVKSCWKIYKGRKHGSLEDGGYRFLVISKTNEDSYKKMIILFLYMERNVNKNEPVVSIHGDESYVTLVYKR